MCDGATDDGSLIYVESRSRLLRMLAIAVGFIVVGAAWVWTGGPDSGRWSGPFPMTVMVLSLLLGVVGLTAFAPRLVGSPRVLLVLDDDGFDDQASLMPAGRVQWSEVTELKLMRISGNDNIAIRVSDAERIQGSRGRAARLVAAANRKWADVWIAGSTLPVPVRQVVDEMRIRWMRSTDGAPPDQTAEC